MFNHTITRGITKSSMQLNGETRNRGYLIFEVLLALLLSVTVFSVILSEVRALGRIAALHRRHDSRENCLRQTVFLLSRGTRLSESSSPGINREELITDECQEFLNIRCDAGNVCKIEFPKSPALPPIEVEIPDAGFTVLEVLVSLVLSAVILLGVVTSCLQSTSTLTRWRQDAADRAVTEKLRLLLENWVKQGSAFHFADGARVERADPSSLIFRALSAGRSFPPIAGDKMFVFRFLDPGRIWLRQTAVHPSSVRSLAWCRQALSLPGDFIPNNKPTHHGALLITLDGTFDVEAEFSRVPDNTANCPYRSELSRPPALLDHRSITGGNTGELPPESSWIGIVGIDQEFVLYRDGGNRLRKASLVSSSNEVIAGPFENIELDAGEDLMGRFLRLSARVDPLRRRSQISLRLPPERHSNPIDLVF